MDLAYLRRRWTNRAMIVASLVCTLAVLAPLFFILSFLAHTGLGALNLDFFTRLPGRRASPAAAWRTPSWEPWS